MKKTPKLHLAPMAGITDRATREMALDMGADFTTTEMVSVKGLYYGDEASQGLLDRDSGKKTGVQIFGSDPEIIYQVIKDHINQMDFAFLDFNMGCPAPKIFKNHEGSYLMKEPDLAFEICQALVEASELPVHLKFRLGVTSQEKNYLEIGRLAERAGVDVICLHGRTRAQFYEGQADWEAIRELNEEVAIPVIANGDIDSPERAKEIMELTGCDQLMIGRAALGNPFIFREIKEYFEKGSYERPSIDELEEAIKAHYDKAICYKGDRALKEMRKQIAWYLKSRHGAARIRNEINKMNSLESIMDLLESYLDDLRQEGQPTL